MADTLQLRGGPEFETNIFTGAEREVTVDTTNWNLRVHDGSTPGGHTLMKKIDYENGYAVLMAAKASNADPQLHGTVLINGLIFPGNDGTAGQAIITDGVGNLSFGNVASGGGGGSTMEIIAPFAHAFIKNNNPGTGTGISWGPYDTNTGATTFTFNEPQPDTDYTVVTDREHYDSHMILINSKTVTGFNATWVGNDGGSPLSPDMFPGALLCYASDPTVSVYGDGGGGGGGAGDASGFLWNANLIPQFTDTYDLGDPNHTIRQLYIQNDAIHFESGTVFGVANGNLSYNGTELTATFAQLNSLNARVNALENTSFLIFE